MSGIFKLNLADLLRGLITAVLTASLTTLQQFFSTTGTPAPINWKLVGGVAAATAVGYLLKNLLTTDTGKVLGIAATAGPPAPHDEFADIAKAGQTGQSSIEVVTFPPFKDGAERSEPEIIHVESDPASPRLAEPSPAAVRAELTQAELLALMHLRDRAQAVVAGRSEQVGAPAAPVGSGGQTGVDSTG